MDDDEGLECPVCMEDYNEGRHVPKMMPCLHTACASCLVDLTKPKGGGRSKSGRGQDTGRGTTGEPVIPRGEVLSCPLCRSDVHTERIQTNRYVLAHLRHLIKLEERMREKGGGKPNETELGGKQEEGKLEEGQEVKQGEKDERRLSEGCRIGDKMDRRIMKRKLRQQIQEARRERREIVRQERQERQERRALRRAPPPPLPLALPLTAKGKRHHAPPPPPHPPRTSSSSSLYPNLEDFEATKSSSSSLPPPPLRPSPRSHRAPPPPLPPPPPPPPPPITTSPPSPPPPSPPLPKPSAPPHEDEEEEEEEVEEEENMWCRTCEEVAHPSCSPSHHLTPLLQSEELEWIERQHQREEELKRRHLQAEEDRRLALKLAGVAVDRSTTETEENGNEEGRGGGGGDKNNSEETKNTKEEENVKMDNNKLELNNKNDKEEEEEEKKKKKKEEEEEEEADPSLIDLSEWSYTQIRDVINTSCDPHLLQACHREFDLRRKEYHRTLKRKGWRRTPRRAPNPVTSP